MTLHPQSREFLRVLAEQNLPTWQELSLGEARKRFAELAPLFGKGPAMQLVRDERTPDGVAVRIFVPAGAGQMPVVMYFHGGGWVLGDLNTHDTLCRRLAASSSCVVVAVDYRRAPEHKYPAALDDCYAATQFVHQGGFEIGGDTRCMIVAGDSAGGNLATAVALRARDENGPPIAGQLLIYPVIEPSFETDSYNQFADGFGLTRATMQWFWRQYLHNDDQQLDPYAVPTRAASLQNLPPAHVITAEYDVLRDEGDAYARRLAEAGVAVSWQRYPGMIHGFVHLGKVFSDSQAAITEAAQVVTRLASQTP